MTRKQEDEPAGTPAPRAPGPRLDAASFMAIARRQQAFLLADESAGYDLGEDHPRIAIYSLADPRALRSPRYIGQTTDPARRHLQHLRNAQPWEVAGSDHAWWHTPHRLLALYAWIRDLWQAEQLLPCLLVHEWVTSPLAAQVAERRRIADGVCRGMALFNFEARRLRDQPGRTRALPFTAPRPPDGT